MTWKKKLLLGLAIADVGADFAELDKKLEPLLRSKNLPDTKATRLVSMAAFVMVSAGYLWLVIAS